MAQFKIFFHPNSKIHRFSTFHLTHPHASSIQKQALFSHSIPKTPDSFKTTFPKNNSENPPIDDTHNNNTQSPSNKQTKHPTFAIRFAINNRDNNAINYCNNKSNASNF